MKHSFLFLTLQDYAGIFSLIAVLLVIFVVLFLIGTSTKSEDKESAKHKVYKVRGRYFFGLTLLAVVILLISLRLLPYPRFQSKPDEVVSVVGMQWSWKIAHGESNKNPQQMVGEPTITLPVNQKIKFIVTSIDVNHNFAIYNHKGVLLTQTQAMPQYKNELEYSFPEKGNYSILCLEYCGLAHPFMTATIHVQ